MKYDIRREAYGAGLSMVKSHGRAAQERCFTLL